MISQYSKVGNSFNERKITFRRNVPSKTNLWYNSVAAICTPVGISCWKQAIGLEGGGGGGGGGGGRA